MNAIEKYEFTSSAKFVRRVVSIPGRPDQKTLIRAQAADDTVADARSLFDQAYIRGVRYRSIAGDASFRVADIFSGCGGLSLGSKEACRAAGVEFEAALAMDHDEISSQVYVDNFAPKLSLVEDVAHVIDGKLGANFTRSEKALLRKVGDVDLVLSGPPCQGHSALNNRTRRNDSRNRLYERVVRLVELLHPDFVLIENVPAVIHAKEGVVQISERYLEELGYVVDSEFVELWRLGVPQLRKRHILIASRRGSIEIDRIVDAYSIDEPRSLEWGIGDLADEPPTDQFRKPSKLSDKNKQRIEFLFGNDLFDLPNHMRPKCHQNGHRYTSMYGRLRYDKPAQTITTGYGSPGQGRYIHPTKRRVLTPHEAARIQFMPDTFDFSAAPTRTSLARMIGNAVPMKVSYIFTIVFLEMKLRADKLS